jgi:Flp pilus assembly protein TadD
MQAGQLAEPSGQLNIDFVSQQSTGGDAEQAAPSLAAPQLAVHSTDQWFERGCRLEENGDYGGAASAYRQVLLVSGPSAELCFNLANALYQLGRKAEASERYRQAVELEPEFVEAWNNLGIVLAELKQCDEAVSAFRRAVDLDPQYADSYFNLADCLEENDCADQAREYWRAYAKLDPASEWGRYALQRAEGRVDSRAGSRTRPTPPK